MSPNKSSHWSKAHQGSTCCWERKMNKFHWKLFLNRLYWAHALKSSCSSCSPLVFKQQINLHPCAQSKTAWCWSSSLQAVCYKFKLLLVMCSLSPLKFSFDWPVFLPISLVIITHSFNDSSHRRASVFLPFQASIIFMQEWFICPGREFLQNICSKAHRGVIQSTT